MPEMESTGWAVWSMHVLEELKRLNLELKETNLSIKESNLTIADNLQKLQTSHETLRLEFMQFRTATITESKVKNSYWGAIAGALMAMLLWGLQYLISH